MEKIKELIVVEGKSDILAVKRAFKGNVDVIATHGLGIKKEFLEELSIINKNKGLIILVDPDYAGKRILNIIKEYIPNIKVATISKIDASKNRKAGVEYASDTAILEAVKKARPTVEESSSNFSLNDIIDNGLSGKLDSKLRRIKLCTKLGITYSNAKQLLIKLNSFGITRSEFNKALEEIEE